MPTFKYAKLVRDNIWRWHEENGHTVTGSKLSGAELRAALCEKLHEEADEVNGALSKEELAEEIADVRQILDDLQAEEGITEHDVKLAQDKKHARKGGFREGHYIDTVLIPDEKDEWAEYCRKDPGKYPEIKASGHVDPDLPTLEMGTYRHTKSGQLYEVISVTFNTETYEPLVIYKPLYEHGKYELFARPYAVFVEEAELNGIMKPRFEKVDE